MSIFLGANLSGESRAAVEAVAAGLPEGALERPEYPPHVTFAYADVEIAQGATRTALLASVAQMAAWRAGLIVTVTGWARFLATDEGMDALVLLVDNWRLPYYFLDATRAIEGAHGTIPNHGFIPHVTLGYLPSVEPTPEIVFEPFEVTLDALTLTIDGESVELPLMEAVKAAGGGGTVGVTKAANGDVWWMGLSSSCFEDRDREIVAKAALEAAVQKGDAGAGYGALNWWHEEALPIGTIEWSAVVGDHLMQAGRFHDPAVGEAMLKAADDLAFSIEFTHPVGARDADGTYHDITLTGCALLPRGKESNRYTALSGRKETRMGAIEQKLRQLAELTGDEAAVVGVLDGAIAKRREALADGARRKEAGGGDGATVENPQSEGEGGDAPAPADNAPDEQIIGTEGSAAAKPGPEAITALFATEQAREAMDAAVTKALAGIAERAATKEAALSAALDEAQTALKALGVTQETQGAEVKALAAKIAELTGEQPRGAAKALAWFQASTAEETVVAKAAAGGEGEGEHLFSFASDLLGLNEGGPPA